MRKNYLQVENIQDSCQFCQEWKSQKILPKLRQTVKNPRSAKECGSTISVCRVASEQTTRRLQQCPLDIVPRVCVYCLEPEFRPVFFNPLYNIPILLFTYCPYILLPQLLISLCICIHYTLPIIKSMQSIHISKKKKGPNLFSLSTSTYLFGPAFIYKVVAFSSYLQLWTDRAKQADRGN